MESKAQALKRLAIYATIFSPSVYAGLNGPIFSANAVDFTEKRGSKPLLTSGTSKIPHALDWLIVVNRSKNRAI